MKICKICGKEKDLSEFYTDTTMSDNLFSKCKVCCKVYRDNSKKRISEIHKKYYLKNKERIKQYIKQYKENERFGRKREEILKRDFYKCVVCKKSHHETSLAVHHIDGNGRGVKNPNNDPSNLITMCESCHHSYHGKIMWKTRIN